MSPRRGGTVIVMPTTPRAKAGPALEHRADLDDAFALLVVDELQARRALNRAWTVAEARGDVQAQVLSAAGSIAAIGIEFADFRGLGDAIARFKPDSITVDGLRPIDRVRIDAASVALPSLNDNEPEALARAKAAAPRLLESILDDRHWDERPDERVLHAKLLVDHFHLESEFNQVRRVAAALQEHLQQAEVAPPWQARWWILMQLNHEYTGDVTASQSARDRARVLIDRHDLRTFRFVVANIQMREELWGEEDAAMSERLYRELETLMPDVRAGLVPHGLRAQAWWLMRRGRFAEALDKMDLVLTICADVQVPQRDLGNYRIVRAHCLLALRRPGVIEQIEECLPFVSGPERDTVTALVAIARAAIAMRDESDDTDALIAAALSACVRIGYDRFLMQLPELAGRFAEAALDRGIEPEFLRVAIQKRRLVPGDPTREDWPWRLKVRVLGELSVSRDGSPIVTSGKGQRKPLELLALLASFGGRPVSIDAVIDQLWPSLEANAPRASFDMTMTRLRRLLDIPDAIRIADGTVGLNTAVVWTDVAAFERSWEPVMTEGSRSAALAERMLSLYRDRLLGSEDVTGMLIAVRERLAAKFMQLVVDQGAALEARGDWRAATMLYERGLARETLAEPIHRALMRAHLELGERAEALRTYRRCKQLLLAVLGTEPSPQTQALARLASEGG
ncbi:hypothetical protein BH10PSE17_BH10PSE17_02360 [soil metagenome]